ncbi:MAG: AMP-binding protein, partial [Burkholderiales bacterium]
IVVNINPLYTEYEVEYLLQNSGAKVVIVLDLMAKKLNNLYGKNGLEHVVVTKVSDPYPFIKRNLINFALKYIKRVDSSYTFKAHDYRDLLSYNKTLSYIPEVKSEDLAFIQYTGATTGKPKGAMLSHGNVVANIDQIYAWLIPQIELTDHVVIDALPLYHIFSLTANLFTFFFTGNHNIMIPNPRDVKDVVKTLVNNPFTVFSALDTLYSHLLNSAEFTRNKYPYFKYSVAGGMPARSSVANEWYELTKVMPSNCYGLTEASPAVTMNPMNNQFDGSVGFPIPSTEVEIRNLVTGEPLPLGQTGAVYIRGPQLMRGYWNAPEQTAAALDKDGWFNTKDIGYLNEQGKLFLNGRQSEMIIVSGFNVYPAEVEAVLDQIPAIKEVAVTGMANKLTGEAVVAFVVLHPEQEITEAEIVKQCRKKLTSYKVPRQVFMLKELPKTLVGKIDKVALSKQHLDKA